jgi:hypothetical protein
MQNDDRAESSYTKVYHILQQTLLVGYLAKKNYMTMKF